MMLEMTASRWMSIHPGMFFVGIVVLLWAGTRVGGVLRRRRASVLAEESSSFKTLESAVLALLGLLLGFTFSMGVSRYDLRKQLEIAEANDIATVWLRTSLLPEPARTQQRQLLREYVPVRLQFLDAGTDAQRIQNSLDRTAALQASLWDAASAYVNTARDAVSASYTASLNSAFDDTEKRTAAFENRIPFAAWLLLLTMAFVASMLVGVGISTRSHLLRLVLPVVVACALSLTLDLDSPRSGLIRVHQRSMERLSAAIR